MNSQNVSDRDVRPGKRERTRRSILDAAIRVFADRGISGAPIHEIAAAAGVANGTFYGHFRDREELEQAVAAHLADRLSHAVARSFGDREDPAEWVAIGMRVFLGQAERDPDWGRTMMRFFGRTDGLAPVVRSNVAYDIERGLERGRFEAASPRLAQDVVIGLVAAAGQSVIEGNAPEGHAEAAAALALRALGVPAEEAEEIAARPLPPFEPR